MEENTCKIKIKLWEKKTLYKKKVTPIFVDFFVDFIIKLKLPLLEVYYIK